MSEFIEQEELDYLRSGGESALAELYSRYNAQLVRIIEFRLDRRLYGRVDPADILQEAYLEISRRLPEYLANPRVSFFVWARQIAWQTLLMTHRRHLDAQKRSVGQEVAWRQPGAGNATSICLASKLIGDVTTPSQAMMRDEKTEQMRAALDAMDPIDREVLALRHFEQLSNNEVAEVLEIQKTTASNRYVRALERLRVILDEVMGEEP